MKQLLFLITGFFLYSFQASAMQEHTNAQLKTIRIASVAFQKYLNHVGIAAAVSAPALSYGTNKTWLFAVSLLVAPQVIQWCTNNLKKLSDLERSFWNAKTNPIDDFLGS